MRSHRYNTKKHMVDMDEPSWINTVRTKLNECHPKTLPSRQWTIFKVPEKIRRSETKVIYDPLITSIGPYHYHASQRGTSLAMQNHKWRCVRWLLSRHRSKRRATVLLDKCLFAMKALDVEVRSCYSDDFYYFDPHKLASIMLLDGCFIIHLLLKQLAEKTMEKVLKREDEGEEDEKKVEVEESVELDIEDEEEIEGPLLGMQWIWNLVLFDLLKLENQIPFFVIETLFDILKTPADEDINLPKLALQLFASIHPSKSETSSSATTLNNKNVHHLLHLFHSTIIPTDCDHRPCSIQTEMAPEWIPSATKLQQAGIKFVKKKIASTFLDISFKNGTLEIPELCLYDYTNTHTLFRNLVAFEQCYPGTKSYMTSYTTFMKCLIDSSKDVYLLESKGILINQLRPQDAVANLFNQLCNQIYCSSDKDYRSSDKDYLRDLFVELKNYNDARWHKWGCGLIKRSFQ
ncbi:hypothetical protein J5N97_010664 [Dioscorea zingiberensis]|uniref:Uncharacterized protein n=1 Tax=Dioscorea zingiberensis TaxID=325984 RepID=A0A9D5D0H1_9LILI|nr:hypothetical protein J5N97_010664 [Dioscorea zingiberensis]